MISLAFSPGLLGLQPLSCVLAGDLRDLVVVEEGGGSRHAGCGIGLRPDEVDGDAGRLGLADGVHGRRRLHGLEGDAVHALGHEVAHDLDLHVRVDLAVDGSRFGTAIRRDLDEPVALALLIGVIAPQQEGDLLAVEGAGVLTHGRNSDGAGEERRTHRQGHGPPEALT